MFCYIILYRGKFTEKPFKNGARVLFFVDQLICAGERKNYLMCMSRPGASTILCITVRSVYCVGEQSSALTKILNIRRLIQLGALVNMPKGRICQGAVNSVRNIKSGTWILRC